MKDDCIEKQYSTKLLNIATDLIDAIQNGKALKPTFFSLIAFHIQQKYYRFSDRAGAYRSHILGGKWLA